MSIGGRKKDMAQIPREEILSNAREYFIKFFNNKAKNYAKQKAAKFRINPFTIQATAKIISDDVSPESIAKALVYPFVMGTSMATSFGTQTQEFITQSLEVEPSVVTGMDIEYTDVEDGYHKYCQVKAGPATINKDDIDTIVNHFKNVKNLGRTNHRRITDEDCVVGVLYGTHDDLSRMYKRIEEKGYVVLAGEQFWYHITGYKGLYHDLVLEAQNAAEQSNVKGVVDDLIQRTTEYIENNKDKFGLS